MNDVLFSSLVYRIIGKPERWHDDYIVDMMQQYLDQTDSIEDPFNLTELAAGDHIISRIKQGNAALTAFNTLLDQSRFQMIILDQQLKLIYYNKNSAALFDYLQHPEDTKRISFELESQIRETPKVSAVNEKNELLALDFYNEQGEQIYLRSIQSQVNEGVEPILFHILMVLDKEHASLQLNAELVAKYNLTEKEQTVLLTLIQGKGIRDIAAASFTSENTVKSHLKSIFKKTRTKSQGALISLILTNEAQVLDSYFESNITTITSKSPSNDDREVTLANGNKIDYCEYGPADGRPLIVFHSGFGSRLAIPSNYKEACQRTNRRVIIPDRPGIGRSPFKEGHPIGWNTCLQEFIDLLEIETYDVLGSIIACQMAVSFAAQADERLQRLILTSPVVLNEDSHLEYLTEILQPAARFVRVSPAFAHDVYLLWLKSVTLNLEEHYLTMLKGSIGSAERQPFAKDNVLNLLTDVFKEGASQTINGIADEMVFCLTPLNLDLNKIDQPVDIWYGTEDKRITEKGAQTVARLFNNHELHICEGYSEHIYYSLFEQIIT